MRKKEIKKKKSKHNLSIVFEKYSFLFPCIMCYVDDNFAMTIVVMLW